MAKSKHHSAPRAGLPAGSADEDTLIDRALAELGATVSAGDVLAAEVQASALITLLYLTDGSAKQTAQLTEIFVTFAVKELHGPDASAYLRLLVALGPRAVKRAASEALARFTADGVYPPEWVTSIGKPTPGQAWRRYDVAGDREVVVVTYRYEDAEHALLVAIDLAERPLVGLLLVGEDAAGIIKNLSDQAEPWERFEQITLAEARRRIEPGLIRADEEQGLPRDDPSVQYLPLARSRVRRLPSADPVELYTADDRAAAVDEFLRGPQGAEAGDPETARFWAQVLTGYGSRVPGEPPAQVGPQRLAVILLVHVPATFTLSAVLLDGFRQAVTAWTRWAATYQDLDDASAEHLMSRVPEVLAEFQDAYDDPFNAEARDYLRDLVSSDASVAWLEDQRARREFAVPLTADRGSVAGSDARDVDVTGPDGRAEVTVAEFTPCAPEGAAGETFLAAARRVVEELWHDDPTQTWQEAKRLSARLPHRHDVIHALVDDAHGGRAGGDSRSRRTALQAIQ